MLFSGSTVSRRGLLIVVAKYLKKPLCWVLLALVPGGSKPSLRAARTWGGWRCCSCSWEAERKCWGQLFPLFVQSETPLTRMALCVPSFFSLFSISRNNLIGSRNQEYVSTLILNLVKIGVKVAMGEGPNTWKLPFWKDSVKELQSYSSWPQEGLLGAFCTPGGC